ncbi:MAG: hypothetical protein COW66_02425 [Flavobacteriaceae bacterium CG18_big_fil_WC_8_21_14_2_50_34_36]|nr:MAG: hypothetical protein COW66_02425 [Flavobacteriaceae bacterium CG18_big_fil_WC_8_21_14_2_50_34_36]PIZ08956.1 MAG: hypothetical protein COY56_01225 [Flavobacteriaceae bacterium CG_4_10_14_0_8_um_filter_34_31]
MFRAIFSTVKFLRDALATILVAGSEAEVVLLVPLQEKNKQIIPNTIHFFIGWLFAIKLEINTALDFPFARN